MFTQIEYCTHIINCTFHNTFSRSFDFEMWRIKLQQWQNEQKIEVKGWFRRFDTDNDGALTREEFMRGLKATSTYNHK